MYKVSIYLIHSYFLKQPDEVRHMSVANVRDERFCKAKRRGAATDNCSGYRQ